MGSEIIWQNIADIDPPVGILPLLNNPLCGCHGQSYMPIKLFDALSGNGISIADKEEKTKHETGRATEYFILRRASF